MAATMRARLPDNSGKLEELPLTPMIDVIFQLIIFFMLMPMNKTLEGHLASQLPKRGWGSGTGGIVRELRIHLQTAGEGQGCVVRVESGEIGIVQATVSRNERDRAIAENNKAVWRRFALRVAELYRMLPPPSASGESNPVVIDAGAGVPWEHIVAVVDACRAQGIDHVEFAASPRFADLIR
ncbi:MAG: hypothetical protein A2Z34_07010 [Planctomycetes bacterium RBG_16_59_8]|nr:MAG: hypothetical protein A2Z34_07010 [Planctomycetes bacterium RBG_16_59_8]